MKKAVKVLLGIVAAGATASAVIYAVKKYQESRKYPCDDYFDYMEEETNDEE